MFYTVIEVQESKKGVRSVLPTVFDNETSALAAFYTVLSAAAVSDIPYHSAHILRSDGIITDGRVFDRHVVEEA